MYAMYEREVFTHTHTTYAIYAMYAMYDTMYEREFYLHFYRYSLLFFLRLEGGEGQSQGKFFCPEKFFRPEKLRKLCTLRTS